jgi:hypothetical protein
VERSLATALPSAASNHQPTSQGTGNQPAIIHPGIQAGINSLHSEYTKEEAQLVDRIVIAIVFIS